MTVRKLAEHHGSERVWEGIQFKAIFALTFAVYIVIGAARRCSPAYWRLRAHHRSLLADACAAAGTTAQMAFAG